MANDDTKMSVPPAPPAPIENGNKDKDDKMKKKRTDPKTASKKERKLHFEVKVMRQMRKAYKKAKVFETQKLTKKLKTLRESLNKEPAVDEKTKTKTEDKIQRTTKEISVLKTIGCDHLAVISLSAIDIKMLTPYPAPAYSEDDAAIATSLERRLLDSKAIKDELLLIQNDQIARHRRLKSLKQQHQDDFDIDGMPRKDKKKRSLPPQNAIFVQSLKDSGVESQPYQDRFKPRKPMPDRQSRSKHPSKDKPVKRQREQSNGPSAHSKRPRVTEPLSAKKSTLTPEELHPSWAAKKMAKEKQGLQEFKGTRVVFDDE
eukprot:GILK01009628.1.p1 GENE.GILK01009628.1~~GILK01009628.1.p1  ORF type:complete len:329 (+),score=72.71 GILK01009628.1:40-987(+)